MVASSFMSVVNLFDILANKMKVYRSLFFLFLFCYAKIQAQSPFFKHYTTEHGLPSMETYQVRQDSKGYIWVATDRGICKFNGTEFKLYNQENGLQNTTIFSLKEDEKGRMWAGAYSGSLFYFENGRFNLFPHSDKLAAVLGPGGLLDDIVIVGDTLWLTGAARIVKIDTQGKVSVSSLSREESILEYREVSPGKYLPLSFIREDDTCFLKIPPFPFKELHISNFNCSNLLSKHSIKRLSSGDLFIAFCQGVIVVKPDGRIIDITTGFRTMNSSIFEDDNGIIWLGVEKGGVIKFDPSNEYKVIDRILDKYSVTFIEKDREGGMWFTTIEEGVIYMPSPNIVNFEFEGRLTKKKYTDLEICNGELYVSSFYGLYKVSRSQFNTWQVSKIEEDKVDGKIINILCFKRSLFLSIDNDSYLFKEGEMTLLRDAFGYMLADSNFFYSMMKRISKIDSSGNVIEDLIGIEFGGNKVRTAYLDDEEQLWLGKLSGLEIFRGDSLYSLCANIPAFCNRITNIRGDSKYIFVSTLGAGIVRINKRTKELLHLNVKNGLPDNNCSAIYLESSGNLWAATSKGICYFTATADDTYDLKKKYTALDGIVKGEVVDLLEYDNHIWILAQDGLSAIPKEHHNIYSMPPPIKFSSATLLNEDSVSLADDVDLSYTQNDIKFEFEGISYKNAFKKTYAYRLLGLDSNYTYTLDNVVQFISLQPGQYTFEVKALNGDNIMSKKAASFSFTIVPPVWQKTWFQVTFVLLAVLGVIAGIRLKDRAKNSKIKMELSILENEQKAVTAQINPHFIYNAMNSIQYYILENNMSKAVDYLARSSNLMRKVLMNTKNSFILLSSELAILELYLQLEKERFEDKFTYQFDIDSSLNLDGILIPSMIVQPHIENAIWHGLLKKDSGLGKLNITLSSVGEELVWSIEDNGIGREASRKKDRERMHGYTSSGIDLTQKRLDLLSKQHGNKYSIRIVDLKDENGIATGTKVMIEMYKRTTKV